MVANPHMLLVGADSQLAPLAELFTQDGALTYVCDPYGSEPGSSKAGITQMIESARTVLGHIDTMVFCEGVRAAEDGRPDADRFVQQTLTAVNCLLSSVGCLALKMIQDRIPGQIIVVCDSSAVAGRSDSMISSTVGGALIGMSKSLAKELGRYRIAVNVICLGPIAGGDQESRLTEAEAIILKATGTGKPATLTHVANNIRHLARGEHWMNGQILYVNDGMIM